MTAAGYFTDDEIRNAIINAGYEIPGASQPQTTAPNIIGAQLNQGGGGGGTDRITRNVYKRFKWRSKI